MSEQTAQAPNRLVHRKALTRAALVRAAQACIAAGRTNVPILEITQAADVGMGVVLQPLRHQGGAFPRRGRRCPGRLRCHTRRAHRGPHRSRRGLRPKLPAHRQAAPPIAGAEQGPAPQRTRPGRLGQGTRTSCAARHRNRGACRPLHRRPGPRTGAGRRRGRCSGPRPPSARPFRSRRRGSHRSGNRRSAAHVRP
jgi:hypothetical protein